LDINDSLWSYNLRNAYSNEKRITLRIFDIRLSWFLINKRKGTEIIKARTTQKRRREKRILLICI